MLRHVWNRGCVCHKFEHGGIGDYILPVMQFGWSYRLWAFHHGCWCGYWLHSFGSHSGHVGWSLQGWQAGELAGFGRWENYAYPVRIYGHRWSGFLQRDIKFQILTLYQKKCLMWVLSNVLCPSHKCSSGKMMYPHQPKSALQQMRDFTINKSHWSWRSHFQLRKEKNVKCKEEGPTIVTALALS